MQTVTNQAPSTYTFRGSSGADTIIISADPGQPGYLRIVDNGTTTNSADPTGTLQILGLGGTDTITVDALDAGFNGNLDIYGTAALALGDLSGPATAFSFSQIHHADEALFGAEGLSVEIAGAVGLGAGNFVALVQTFTVDSSASLSTAGTVNVLAEDIATTPETVVFVSTRSASISIGDHATISAASVSLVAYSWDGGNLSEQAAAATPSPAGQDALYAAGSLVRILDKFIGTFPVSVVVKTATTSVSVGTDAVLSATNGSLQLFSVASVASNGEPASEFFTVGYAGATATATVAIATGARLTATGAVDVLVNGEADPGDVGEHEAPAQLEPAGSHADRRSDRDHQRAADGDRDARRWAEHQRRDEREHPGDRHRHLERIGDLGQHEQRHRRDRDRARGLQTPP